MARRRRRRSHAAAASRRPASYVVFVFFRVTLSDWLAGDPPVGEKVIFGFTFTLPILFSFFLALPLALIVSFTVPARRAKGRPAGRWATRFLPLSVSVPAPGTLTVIVAVPFFLFSFGLPCV